MRDKTAVELLGRNNGTNAIWHRNISDLSRRYCPDSDHMSHDFLTIKRCNRMRFRNFLYRPLSTKKVKFSEKALTLDSCTKWRHFSGNKTTFRTEKWFFCNDEKSPRGRLLEKSLFPELVGYGIIEKFSDLLRSILNNWQVYRRVCWKADFFLHSNWELALYCVYLYCWEAYNFDALTETF